jgi:hypothetical protein
LIDEFGRERNPPPGYSSAIRGGKDRCGNSSRSTDGQRGRFGTPVLSATRLQRNQRKSEKCAETACYRRWASQTHPTRHSGGLEMSEAMTMLSFRQPKSTPLDAWRKIFMRKRYQEGSIKKYRGSLDRSLVGRWTPPGTAPSGGFQ